MKTFYSGNVEITVDFRGLDTGNYTYRVREYAPVPGNPKRFAPSWTPIYEGTCFIIAGSTQKTFNISDIVAARKEYYENFLQKNAERVNLINQYDVVIYGEGGFYESDPVQVIFFEQYPNYKSSMNPLGIQSEDLFGNEENYYPLMGPLLQGVGDPEEGDDNTSIPVLTPRLPLANYSYPLVMLSTPAYQYEPFELTTDGAWGLNTDLAESKLKYSPTFVYNLLIRKIGFKPIQTTVINPTNEFVSYDYIGFEETFSSQPYRNFEWTPTASETYNFSIYVTDRNENIYLGTGTLAPGSTSYTNGLLTSSQVMQFIYTHQYVELAIDLKSENETKYINFDCDWIKTAYPQDSDTTLNIYYSIEISRAGYLQVDFGERQNPDIFSNVAHRKHGDSSLYAESWFTTPDSYTELYDSDIWEVTQPGVGEYTARNIPAGSLFWFSIKIKTGDTVDAEFRLGSNTSGSIIDTSEPQIANILNRIDRFYPESTIILRLQTVDSSIEGDGYVEIEITSLIRNMSLFSGTYIELATARYGEGQSERMVARIKFRDKDLKERCKIAEIDSPQCTELRRYYLMWQDRFGGFQCQPFEKTSTFQEDLKRHEWATYQNAKRLGGIEVQPKWKLNTGWIKDELYPYYESILISPYIMMIDVVENKTYRVLVNDSNYTEKTFKNQGRQLFNLELTVSEDKPQQILY